MSDLKVEELQELSVPQLKKYAAGVEGEDLVLVNTVIANKEARKNQLAAEANVKLTELEEAKKAIIAAEAEAKAEAIRVKAELKEAALAAKIQIDAEKAELKAAAIEAKLLAKAAGEEAKAVKLAEKAEKDAAKAAEKLAKEAAKAEAKTMSEERYAALQAELIRRKESGEEITVGNGQSKSATIKELYTQGLSNQEIAEVSGIGRKMVCDIVWGIKQKEKEAQFLAEYRARKEAEKLAENVQATVTEDDAIATESE